MHTGCKFSALKFTGEFTREFPHASFSVFAGVTPAAELANIGRVAPGDVLFVHRNAMSTTSAVRMNHQEVSHLNTVADFPHARVQRVAGLDYINRALGPSNYQANHTILVNSLAF